MKFRRKTESSIADCDEGKSMVNTGNNIDREETKITSPHVSHLKGSNAMNLGENLSNSSIEDLHAVDLRNVHNSR